LSIFRQYLENIRVTLDLTTITGTLHEDLCTFKIKYLAQFFLEWEMFNTNIVEKTNILCSISFYFRKSCLYEIISKKMVKPDRPQMRI